MKKLKELLTEARTSRYPAIFQGNNYLSTEWACGIWIACDNGDPRDYSKAGHTLHITFGFKGHIAKDIILDNQDKIKVLFLKHFKEIYDRPRWNSPSSDRISLFSPGTLGGMNWLHPHFSQFVYDINKLIYKELYDE